MQCGVVSAGLVHAGADEAVRRCPLGAGVLYHLPWFSLSSMFKTQLFFFSCLYAPVIFILYCGSFFRDP